MLKNLRIGTKMTLAFAGVVGFLIIVAGTGFFALSKASQRFTEYRETALNSNLSSLLQANMLMLRIEAKDFLRTSSDEDQQGYRAYREKLYAFLAEAKQRINDPEQAEKIAKVAAEIETYDIAFKQ